MPPLDRTNRTLIPWLALVLALGVAPAAPALAQASHAALAPGPEAAFPVWRSITTAARGSARTYRNAFDAAKIRIGNAADEIVGRPAFPYLPATIQVDLAVVSSAELGLAADHAPLAEIYQRARALGLDLCPAETALQLRLDYLDQPVGDILHVAMEPVRTYAGEPTILALAHFGSGALVLGSSGAPDFRAPRAWRFLFARPRPSRVLQTVADAPDGGQGTGREQ